MNEQVCDLLIAIEAAAASMFDTSRYSTCKDVSHQKFLAVSPLCQDLDKYIAWTVPDID